MYIPKIHPHTGHYIPAGAVVRGGRNVSKYVEQKTRYEQQEENNHQSTSETDWGAIVLGTIIAVAIIGYLVSIIVSIVNKIRDLFLSIKKRCIMTDKELEKLMKLVVLRNNGALTDEEFEKERRKITTGR